jgi:NTP pyrophosphatase (non-canonical NTP hydrolase)
MTTIIKTTNIDSYIEALEEFSDKYEHHRASEVSIPPDEVVDLRRRLILEEARELIDALAKRDVRLVADGLADLLYVTFGTALAFGIPMERVFLEVHRSNMTKSYEKKGGKSVKGPDYEPPNFDKILFGLGDREEEVG